MEHYESVLTFWFSDIEPQMWWQHSADFDALIARHFSDLLARAAQGECAPWRENARGRLAEIIVLDQFSRHIYRDSPQAYAQDALALQCAQEAVRIGADRLLPVPKRAFMYMPYMHSEDRRVHDLAIKLFSVPGMEHSLSFERKHKSIIDRFGRYPHRNAVLGRENAFEEIKFLQQTHTQF